LSTILGIFELYNVSGTVSLPSSDVKEGRIDWFTSDVAKRENKAL
jgi:hypothetical protein